MTAPYGSGPDAPGATADAELTHAREPDAPSTVASPPARPPVPEPPAGPPVPEPPARPPVPEPPAERAPADARADDPGPRWAQGPRPSSDTTTVLPTPAAGAARRSVPARPAAREPRAPGAAAARPLSARSRRARLTLRRIDPWSVFLFSLVASVFLGIALVVAVAVLYSVLGTLGVTASVNELFAEVTGGSPTTGPLLTSRRIVGGAAVLAAVNVVFLTLLATLGALLYNLCASFTGGIELTLGERG